jgi:putative DNA primase/helicase
MKMNVLSISQQSGKTRTSLAGRSFAKQSNPVQISPPAQKTDDWTEELRFATETASNACYSIEGGEVYFWNGLFHENVPYRVMKPRAFAWLEKNAPKTATANKAEALVDAALLKLRPLPKRDDSRVLVPVQNGYLEAHPDGTLEWLDADPALGVCYALNVTLPRNGNVYQPSQIPHGSLLAHYFNTSIPDVETRAFLQEMSGDTLIPNVRFQRATVLKGEGKNGKSIFTRLMAALHHRVAYKQLDNLKGFDLMDLVGASLAIADEVPATRLNEQAFKALVSGEPMSVDRKHKDPISASMTAKWIICTNNDQRTADNSYGFWRRVVIIPFDQAIEGKDVIPELDKKIIANELGYFLDWCLNGLQRLLRRGDMPPLPAKLEMSKAQAVAASDPVLAWIEDRFVAVTERDFIKKEDFYGLFADWAYKQGFRNPPSSPIFWKSIKRRFGTEYREAHPRIGNTRSRVVYLTYE